MTFKIGNFTIETKEIFDALKEVGITKEDQLKQFDKDDDKILTEDELTEVLLQDEEENEDDKETSSTSSSSASSGTSGSTGDGTSVEEQIQMYEEMNASLREQLNRLCSSMGTSVDMSAIDNALSSIQNIKDQIAANDSNIYKLLLQAEGKLTTSSLSGVNGLTSTGSSSLVSSSGSASGIANYALQYDGKTQAEMQSIMTGKGYRFDWGVWCADFVSFCTKEVYGENALSGCSNTASCWGIGTWAEDNGILMDSRRGTTVDVSKLKPGDYILYNASGGEWYHVGIVTGVNSDGTVNTIEGNTTGGNCASHSHVSPNGASFVLIHNKYGT